MNNITLTGYALEKGKYSIVNGSTEYNFFLKCYSTYSKRVNNIPIKCRYELADKAYARIVGNAYIEIYGELLNDNGNIYVEAITLSIKLPKEKQNIYVRSTEFLELFSPSSIIERIKAPKKEKVDESK